MVTARGTVDIDGAIYITAWAWPALGSVRAGRWLVHLRLLSGSD